MIPARGRKAPDPLIRTFIIPSPEFAEGSKDGWKINSLIDRPLQR
jgi:hypothetical protein